MKFSKKLKQLLINEQDSIRWVEVISEKDEPFLGIIKSVDPYKLVLAKYLNEKFTTTHLIVDFSRTTKVIVELYSGERREFT